MTQRPWSEVPIEELIARARAGEEGALEELLRRYQPRLDRWAARRVSPGAPGGHRPSDLVQESALKAFQKFSSFRGSTEGELVAWLRRVVVSRSTDLARQALSQMRADADHLSLDAAEAEGARSPRPTPSQLSSVQEEGRHLLASFFLLPEDQREALALFHLRELSVAEVAERMGRSKDAVSSLMQRGLRTLRQRMAGATSAAPGDASEEAAMWNAADAALLVWFRRRDAGEGVDPDAFAAEYPACAEVLRDMLHWLERLRAVQPPEDP